MTVHIHAPKGKYYARARKPRQKMWTLLNEVGLGEIRNAKTVACSAINTYSDYKFFDIIFVSDCGYYEPNVVWECRVK